MERSSCFKVSQFSLTLSLTTYVLRYEPTVLLQQGRIKDWGDQSTMRAQSVCAKYLDMPTNYLTTPPNCHDHEAISCFLKVKFSISTKFGTFEVSLLCLMLQ